VPTFKFDPAHKLTKCKPAAGRIRGTFNPGLSGAGTHTIHFVAADKADAEIARCDVTSPDGAPVKVDCPHTDEGDAKVFQRNVRVAFGDEPPGPPQPVCLAH
jgi:hypothetical protein